MRDEPKPCDACGGDGGVEYCTGPYCGEPVYRWAKCAVCEGSGEEPPEPRPTQPSGQRFYLEPDPDFDEEIPF